MNIKKAVVIADHFAKFTSGSRFRQAISLNTILHFCLRHWLPILIYQPSAEINFLLMQALIGIVWQTIDCKKHWHTAVQATKCHDDNNSFQTPFDDIFDFHTCVSFCRMIDRLPTINKTLFPPPPTARTADAAQAAAPSWPFSLRHGI